MILPDSDHLSVLSDVKSSHLASLQARMQSSSDQGFATTIVSAEEQLRGWLALIHRLRDVHQQIPAYERLANILDFLRDWLVMPLDSRAADQFLRLKKQKIRVGAMDLEIASIALVHDALLLSANLRDFRQVPGLRVENWLA